MMYCVTMKSCMIEDDIEGQKFPRKPRHSHISWLKKDAEVNNKNTYAGLKKLAENRKRQRRKSHLVNQLNHDRKKKSKFNAIPKLLWFFIFA